MFYGTVGAVFLHFSGANAADLFTKAPLAEQPAALGAVDGFNGKVDVFGGSYMNRQFFGTKASAAAPLGDRLSPYGVQIDGVKGRFDHRSFGAVGGHLFWRDPSRGLLGIYASYTNWNQFGGIHVGQVAAEGAVYWGRYTLEGIAGVEFGNSASVITGDTVNGFLIQSINIQTRFFDKINVAYYVQDDLKIYGGHRYLGGRNALALGAEWALPFKSRGMQATLFAEARVGEGDFHGIWGGVKVYFGQSDKTLMQRHRQDDPFEWAPESLAVLSIISANIIAGVPLATPPCGDPDGCI
jgi:hypothetical protein